MTVEVFIMLWDARVSSEGHLPFHRLFERERCSLDEA